MHFPDEFESFIQKHRLLRKGHRILLAVSGGIDSVVLLDLFVRIQKPWNLTLSVAHLNHGLRGRKADRDEAFVRNLAQERNLAFYSEKVDVSNYAKAHKLSLEESGREVRFEFLNSLLNRLKYDRVALGHHANDQAETVLMNMVRGSGLRGLRGMLPIRGAVIHPLLYAPKEDIELYGKSRGLDFIVDASNRDRRFLRNRIRRDVLPAFERAVGSHTISGICRSGNVGGEAEAFIEHSARKAREKIVISQSGDEIILDIYKFLGYFKIVKKMVLFQILEEELSRGGVTTFKIDRLLHLAEEGRSGNTVECGDGVKCVRSGDKLAFIRERTPIPDLRVHVGQSVELSEVGIQIRSTLLERKEGEINFTPDRSVEYLDYDSISFPLHVRSFEHGDRFVPLGMGKKKKLHDFFIDEKVPNFRRSSVPLFLGGDDIIWVVGQRIDDRFKVTKQTKKVLKVEIIQIT